MSLRILNIMLFLAFLIGYLEWGKDHHEFIFEAEADVFMKAKNNFLSVLHPLVILPFVGQLLLLFNIFSPKLHRKAMYVAISSLSSLIVVLAFIGLISLRFKMVLFTLPFMFFAMISLSELKKNKASITKK